MNGLTARALGLKPSARVVAFCLLLVRVLHVPDSFKFKSRGHTVEFESAACTDAQP